MGKFVVSNKRLKQNKRKRHKTKEQVNREYRKNKHKNTKPTQNHQQSHKQNKIEFNDKHILKRDKFTEQPRIINTHKGYIKMWGRLATLNTLKNKIDNNNSVFYTRLGDNDIMHISGKYINQILGNNKTKSTTKLSSELSELLKIEDDNYMLGVRITNNSPTEQLSENEYYSADVFSDMVRDGYFEPIQHFFNKYVIPNIKLFIGCVNKDTIEKLLGVVDHYIQTPKMNSSNNIDDIWPKVKNIIKYNKINYIILASGQLSRLLSKRLWKYYNGNPPFHCIDIGSIVDIIAKKPSRSWMTMDNNKHLKTAHYNLLKGLYNDMIYGILITGKHMKRKHLAEVAINNFLEQTYPLKKLIVINTDDHYYSNHKDVDEYLINQNNKTLGDLRNIGLDKVPENDIWIQWDDDDYKSPKLIEYQYDKLKNLNLDYVLLKNQLMYSFKKNSSIPKYKPFIEGTIMAKNKPERYPSHAKGEDTYFLNNLKKKYRGKAVDNPVEYYIRNIHYHNTWDDDHFNLRQWPTNSIHNIGYNEIMKMIDKYKNYYN